MKKLFKKIKMSLRGRLPRPAMAGLAMTLALCIGLFTFWYFSKSAGAVPPSGKT